MQKQVILLSMIDLDGLDVAINDLAQLFPRWEDRVGDAKIWQFIRNLVHAYASEYSQNLDHLVNAHSLHAIDD